jgi:hypothetical protein
MQPVQILTATAPDIMEALQAWQFEIPKRFPANEDWCLVNVHIQPIMRPVGSAIMGVDGKPQMEMAVSVIGFFQREESVEEVTERNARIGMKAAADAYKVMFPQKCEGECTYDTGMKCTRCGHQL